LTKGKNNMKAAALDCIRLLARLLLGLAGLAIPMTTLAQGTSGRASSVVIPVVAKTTSFESEVFVRNPADGANTIDVDVVYFEANNLGTPGLVDCGFITINRNTTSSFKLSTQCPTLAGADSHFGLLVLQDRQLQKLNTFTAFSRVQHVVTNQGFSIEGFPEHTFSGRPADVIGLKRVASLLPTQALPGSLPNCFVGSLGEPVSYVVRIFEGSDGDMQIGGDITGTLGPYELVRYLDILKAATEDLGLPAVGDKVNFRVSFTQTGTQAAKSSDPGQPAFMGFCTQQENFALGADFRMAKSDDEANITKLLLGCRGTSDASCTTLTAPATYTITNKNTKHRFSTFIHHPDFIRCDIVGPRAALMEIQLLAPAPAGQAAGPVVAGGNNASTFYYETGPRNAVVNSGGYQVFWNIDVSVREGLSPPVTPANPFDYGLKCVSGSGIHVSDSKTDLNDDF
jgi:hypothetical protein